MIYINNITQILDETTRTENKLNQREEKQYPMSSESEWSCRVEGSGSQCNVLIQPNHQSVLVRERERDGTGREEEETERMEPNSEPHHGCKRWKEKTERGENQYRVRVNREACWRKKKQRGHFGVFPTDKTAERR